jgi:hypothetical protein
VSPSAGGTPRSSNRSGVTSRTGALSVRSPARTSCTPRSGRAAAIPPIVSLHERNNGAGTLLPIGMIGRSGVPTCTRDSARGSRRSGGAFLNTTSRMVSETVVAPIPPASETIATAAAIG